MNSSSTAKSTFDRAYRGDEARNIRGPIIEQPRLGIAQQFDELHNQLSDLESVIENTSNMVRYFSTPVMAVPDAPPLAGKITEHSTSELDEALVSVTRRVAHITSRVHDINSRLRP
jgi:hypothetical protein